MRRDHKRIVREMLSCPTAPFREEAVVRCVERLAGEIGLQFDLDDAGNVLLQLPGRQPHGPLWLLQAHMDHPAFVVKSRSGRTVSAEFRGSIAKEYFRGSEVRFFTPDGEVRAIVRSARPTELRGFTDCRLTLAETAPVPVGTIGMWDFPGVRFRGSKIEARGCDDVAGAVVAVCALEAIVRRELKANAAVLLTRSEEVGFNGLMAAARAPRDSLVGELLSRAWIIGIETSRAQPGAPLGGGAVIRVGDPWLTFDQTLTAHISAVAQKLAKRRRSFRYVRQLMPGGACESSAWCLEGFPAAAVCLPLGNYHNMGEQGHVRPEQVHADDFSNLVELLVAVGSDPTPPEAASEAMRRAIRDRFEQTGGGLREG